MTPQLSQRAIYCTECVFLSERYYFAGNTQYTFYNKPIMKHAYPCFSHNTYRWLLWCLCLCTATHVATAQTNAKYTIKGTVTDPTG